MRVANSTIESRSWRATSRMPSFVFASYEWPAWVRMPAKFKFDAYYTKFTFAREFPVLGSKGVSDAALLKANGIEVLTEPDR